MTDEERVSQKHPVKWVTGVLQQASGWVLKVWFDPPQVMIIKPEMSLDDQGFLDTIERLKGLNDGFTD